MIIGTFIVPYRGWAKIIQDRAFLHDIAGDKVVLSTNRILSSGALIRQHVMKPSLGVGSAQHQPQYHQISSPGGEMESDHNNLIDYLHA